MWETGAPSATGAATAASMRAVPGAATRASLDASPMDPTAKSIVSRLNTGCLVGGSETYTICRGKGVERLPVVATV